MSCQRGSWSGPIFRPASRMRSRLVINPGEEYSERDLGYFARLERGESEVNPDPGAVDLHADERQQRKDQQGGAGDQRKVGEAAQNTVVAQQPNNGDDDGDGNAGPEQLAGCGESPVAMSSRWIIASPMPFSAVTIGSITGSAYLARRRRTTCTARTSTTKVTPCVKKSLSKARSWSSPTSSWRRCRRPAPAGAAAVRCCAANGRRLDVTHGLSTYTFRRQGGFRTGGRTRRGARRAAGPDRRYGARAGPWFGAVPLAADPQLLHNLLGMHQIPRGDARIQPLLLIDGRLSSGSCIPCPHVKGRSGRSSARRH